MKKIQEEAIAHYDRMIDWAKTQSPRRSTDAYLMEEEIDELWNSGCCVYCHSHNECYNCPLEKKDLCCGGLWKKMNEAKTWQTWIKYAEKVKQYITDNG